MAGLDKNKEHGELFFSLSVIIINFLKTIASFLKKLHQQSQ